jgi:hypothetical protein
MWIGTSRGATHDTPEADLFSSALNIQPDLRLCTSGHIV